MGAVQSKARGETFSQTKSRQRQIAADGDHRRPQLWTFVVTPTACRPNKEHGQGAGEAEDCDKGPGFVDGFHGGLPLDRRPDKRQGFRRHFSAGYVRKKLIHGQADRSCGRDISAGDRLSQLIANCWSPPIEHSVNEGETDGATEIAHQVEQPAGIGDRSGDRRPKAMRMGGRRHSMIATPRKDLRQDHLLEIGRAGLKGTERKTDGKQGKANARQNPRTQAALQEYGNGRHDELCRASDHHCFAYFKQVVNAHECKEHGHQIHRAVEPDTQNEAQRAAKREVRNL